MILVSTLIRERNVFVLHGISIKGANPSSLLYSIGQKYNHIQEANVRISAFTFNPTYDNSNIHFFSDQGFILKEGEIIHAHRSDSGTAPDGSLLNQIEPFVITDMDDAINCERKKYNELLIRNSRIHGFYFKTIDELEDVYYSSKNILDFIIEFSIPLYMVVENLFYRCVFENGNLLKSNTPFAPIEVLN